MKRIVLQTRKGARDLRAKLKRPRFPQPTLPAVPSGGQEPGE